MRTKRIITLLLMMVLVLVMATPTFAAAKINKKSVNLTVGKTVTLKVTGYKGKVKWKSSNTSVATVSSSGKVKAKKPGTAKITAKAGKKSLTCTVKVKAKTPAAPKFTADDYSFEDSEKSVKVEFKINKSEVSEQELIDLGYTVSGGIASKVEIVGTRKYTFKALPTNLNELKQISFDTMFDPMAATICAITTWENKPAYEAMYTHPIYDLMEYCQKGIKIENVYRSSMYTVMQESLKYKYALFDGASPTNGYTPNTPYTFTLVEGPYVLPAKTSITGESIPERHMVLISFAGDDAQRYCDVFNSVDRHWYCWKNTWQNLVAGYKPVQQVWAAPNMDESAELTETIQLENGQVITVEGLHIELQ